MSKFSMIAKFTTKPGKRDELVHILLEGEDSMQALEECHSYIVHVSDTEPDAIWVTEVWSTAEAHQASLALEETKASIQRAMPLIAAVDATPLTPVGGKGS